MKILYKFPSRERPQECEDAVNSIWYHSANKNDYHISLTLDQGDPRKQEYIDRFGECQSLGISTSKIQAINRDMPANYDWDILVVMSDDMRFVTEGFDDIIKADMLKHFPDLDGCLHYNDGNQKDNVMTMSIMGRKYYEKFGYIYHPDYQSLWCDVEATEVAHILRKIVYLGDDKILFQHQHATMTGKKDDLFYRNENKNMWDQDKATFIKRRARYYDIAPQDRKNNYKYLKPF